MNAQDLTPKELKWMMAYLDGVLSDKEKVRFEEKLASSAALKRAVIDQKRLKAALLAVPAHKAPRDFMLTPDMVKARKPAFVPAYPAFRLASVVAAFLMAVVFAGEYLIGPALTARKASPAEEAALSSDVGALLAEGQSHESPDIITWNDPSEQAGLNSEVYGLGGGSDMVTPDAVMPEALVTGFETPEEVCEDEFCSLPEEKAAADEEPVEDLQVLQLENPEMEAEPGNTEALILGVNPDEGGNVVAQSIPEEGVQQPWLGLRPINWVEIGLGILALGSGITTLILRRKS